MMDKGMQNENYLKETVFEDVRITKNTEVQFFFVDVSWKICGSLWKRGSVGEYVVD